MIVFDDLSAPAFPKCPSALTIGSFDGVHRGHQFLLHKMRELIGREGSLCIVTFSNHPSHILPGAQPIELILSSEQKLKWLGTYGADIVYCIPFTQALASQSYKLFLETMMQSCPFDYLVLGQDSRLGHRREGTPERVSAFCNNKGAQALYVDKTQLDGKQISSRRIRKLLALHKTNQAMKLIGHPLDS